MTKLIDIANAQRAENGTLYLPGATLVQISATKGQTVYHDRLGTVEPFYAVISPHPLNGVNPKYLFYEITREMPKFTERYQTGLNIQMEAFNHFEVEIVAESRQLEIVAMMQALEEAEQRERDEIEYLKNLKKTMLDKCFPK